MNSTGHVSRDTGFVVGIDPGISGAVAVLCPGTLELTAVHDIPVVKSSAGKGSRRVILPQALARIFVELNEAHIGPLHAYVEEVSAMPKQGLSSTFNFGVSYGVILGVLAGVGVSYTPVRPHVWKRQAKLLGKSKDTARELASRTWPRWAHMFERVKDDGRAEAALIALSGLQSGLGKTIMTSMDSPTRDSIFW